MDFPADRRMPSTESGAETIRTSGHAQAVNKRLVTASPDRHLVRLRPLAVGAGHGRLGRGPRHRPRAPPPTPDSHCGIFCCSPPRCSVPRCGPRAWRRGRQASKIPASWWWTKCWASGSRWPAAHPCNWKSCLAAFALFRLFDIWKPPPVRQLESLPGGLGHQRRRRHGRRLCGTCAIAGRMVQSILNCPSGNRPTSRPQISQVIARTPPLPAASSRFAGRALPKPDRPRVTIGDVGAPADHRLGFLRHRPRAGRRHGRRAGDRRAASRRANPGPATSAS